MQSALMAVMILMPTVYLCEKRAVFLLRVDQIYAKKILGPNDGYEVGVNTAKLHLITKDLTGKRENKLSVNSWRKIYNKVKKDCSKIHTKLPEIAEKNLDVIEKNWPKNIPSGIIHADLFSDNIFFKDDKLSGIIDYTPLIMVAVWFYGVSLGLLRGNNLVFVFSNFAGMALYLIWVQVFDMKTGRSTTS